MVILHRKARSHIPLFLQRLLLLRIVELRLEFLRNDDPQTEGLRRKPGSQSESYIRRSCERKDCMVRANCPAAPLRSCMATNRPTYSRPSSLTTAISGIVYNHSKIDRSVETSFTLAARGMPSFANFRRDRNFLLNLHLPRPTKAQNGNPKAKYTRVHTPFQTSFPTIYLSVRFDPTTSASIQHSNRLEIRTARLGRTFLPKAEGQTRAKRS